MQKFVIRNKKTGNTREIEIASGGLYTLYKDEDVDWHTTYNLSQQELVKTRAERDTAVGEDKVAWFLFERRCAELTSVLAREKTLREALKPLARLAEDCPSNSPDTHCLYDGAFEGLVLGDARRARAALNPCGHDWVDVLNEIVKSGECCRKCGAIK